MKPDIQTLLADIEALRARCEEAIDRLTAKHDAETARSSGRESSGIPLGVVRQSLVRGQNPFDAVCRLLKADHNEDSRPLNAALEGANMKEKV